MGVPRRQRSKRANRFVAALTRELQEELGISIGRTSALLDIHHDYGDKQVLLDVHMVWDYSGEARSLENQPMAWVSPQALTQYAFPAANVADCDCA